MMSSEFLLIAAPISSSGRDPDERALFQATTVRDLSRNHAFAIPELKVGTLNSLVLLSDDLTKLDQTCESVSHKLAQYMSDLLEDKQESLSSHLDINGLSPDEYLAQFSWDTAKYNVHLPINELSTELSKRISSIELEMKGKVQAYNKVKGNIQAIERKTNGSLLIRSLGELVEEKHFVLDSEFLVTLLVVVPRNSVDEWYRKYESLNDYVVPRSSEPIHEDDEYVLFSVTVFRKMVDDFKTTARENRFVVRDFEFNKAELDQEEDEKIELQSDMQRRFNMLVQWCTVSFQEAFSAWVHVKALRVFVESVLRYGLPVNFQGFVLQPFKGRLKKLRQALQEHYAHLDSSALVGEDISDVPGLAASMAHEYYPYVSFDVNVGYVTCAQ